jgi:uncharacterized protein (DUF305 family)
MFNRVVATRGLKLLLLAGGCSAAIAFAQSAPIVQPGAPGQPSRAIDAATAVKIADTSYSSYDVQFMQDMIPHHAQATQMTALVPSRTNRPEILNVAKRIDATQADEIAYMKKWLSDRNQATENPHSMHMMHDAAMMTQMGMATPAQLSQLGTLKGLAFERQFLTLMINHHAGAVRMAQDLLSHGGSAADPGMAEFVADLIKEQKEEIKRMTALLGTIAEDPRTALKAGTKDAGQAISGLTLVASLPKPTGFFDPQNPYDLPRKNPPKPGEKGEGTEGRSPLLSFAQTDMAFQRDMLAVGNYHGFNLYRINPAGGAPALVSSTICPGGQGDLSLVGNRRSAPNASAASAFSTSRTRPSRARSARSRHAAAATPTPSSATMPRRSWSMFRAPASCAATRSCRAASVIRARSSRRCSAST